MNKTSGFIGKILSIILILLYSFLFLINAFGTTVIDKDYNLFREYAHFEVKYPVISLAIFAGLLLLFLHLFKSGVIEKADPRICKWTGAVMIAVTGIAWVFITKGRPLADQEQISVIATHFINNDYSDLDTGRYLNNYPHQLGIIGVVELLYKIFHTTDFRLIMVINALLCAGIFLNLYNIAKTPIPDKRRLNYLSLLFVLMPVFPMHSFFVYGNLFGLFFATLGIRLMIRALTASCEKIAGKILPGIGALFSFTLADICKNNTLIITIASIICGLIYVLNSITVRSGDGSGEMPENGHDRKPLGTMLFDLAIVWLIFLSFLGMKPVYSHYEHVSGKEILAGMPKTLWISMGLQDGMQEWGCGTNGWYNGYSVETFEACEYDAALSDKVARADIAKRLLFFKDHPGEGISFFKEKIVTQWSEPTYQAFWMIDAFDNHGELGALATSIISGKLRHIISVWMRVFVLLVWFGNIVFAVKTFKKPEWLTLILSVSLLGGFLFHIIWEAKALYTLSYTILSLPTAVCGLIALPGFIKDPDKTGDRNDTLAIADDTKAGDTSGKKNILEKYRTEIMGFAALCIFVFHAIRPSFSLKIGDADILSFLVRIGFSGVDVFFFLSGMGLVRSMAKNSLGNYYIHRISRVYFPFLLIGLLHIPVYGIGIAECLKRVTGYSFYFGYMYSLLWFVPAILTLYYFFPLYYMIISRIRRKVAFTVICIAVWFVISMIFADSGSYLYGFTNRIPIFLVGVLYAYTRENKITLGRFIASVITLAAGLVCLFLAEVKNVSFILPVSDCAIPTFLVAVSLPFVLAGIFEKFNGKKIMGMVGKILGFFGKMSLEFYCVQEILVYLLRDTSGLKLPNVLMNLLLLASCTVAGYILYRITAVVSGLIRKIKFAG